MVEIVSNGSTWNGQKKASIQDLIKILKTETIERGFFFKSKEIRDHEKGTYDLFTMCPISKDKKRGCYHFFGNFERVSHVFNIYTDEPKVINKLKVAIMNNEGWKKYINNLRKKVA